MIYIEEHDDKHGNKNVDKDDKHDRRDVKDVYGGDKKQDDKIYAKWDKKVDKRMTRNMRNIARHTIKARKV